MSLLGFLQIAGRICYGIAGLFHLTLALCAHQDVAGESLTVVQSAILTQWFKGRELAFTFGITLAVSRGGSVLNNYLSPALADTVRAAYRR